MGERQSPRRAVVFAAEGERDFAAQEQTALVSPHLAALKCDVGLLRKGSSYVVDVLTLRNASIRVMPAPEEHDLDTTKKSPTEAARETSRVEFFVVTAEEHGGLETKVQLRARIRASHVGSIVVRFQVEVVHLASDHVVVQDGCLIGKVMRREMGTPAGKSHVHLIRRNRASAAASDDSDGSLRSSSTTSD